MFICKFCGSERKSNNSLAQHEIRCKSNADRIPIHIPTTKGIRGKKGSNQYTKAQRLGLPKPEVSEETRNKMRKSAKRQGETMWTVEQREKHSRVMKEAVAKNPESYTKGNVSGRVKMVQYNGHLLKGTWELKTAMWLDGQGLEWEPENYFCEYVWNGGTHRYYPDFYVFEYDVYIEVKGYKTDRDEAKWSQFDRKLVIIDKRVIHELEKKSIAEIIDEYTYGSVV